MTKDDRKPDPKEVQLLQRIDRAVLAFLSEYDEVTHLQVAGALQVLAAWYAADYWDGDWEDDEDMGGEEWKKK